MNVYEFFGRNEADDEHVHMYRETDERDADGLRVVRCACETEVKQ